jgi:parallel beta-helix repeat protein
MAIRIEADRRLWLVLFSAIVLASCGHGNPTAITAAVVSAAETHSPGAGAAQNNCLGPEARGCLQYFVAPSGSEAGDGSRVHPWATLQHAEESLKLGRHGTVVHVAPGLYSATVPCVNLTANLCVSRRGSSESRISFVSDVRWGAKLAGDPNENILVTTGSYHDIVGFDITAPHGQGAVVALDNQGGGRGVGINTIDNFIHDVGTLIGCPSAGAVDYANYAVGGSIIGNVINRAGQTHPCKQMHGIYAANGTVIENNIVSNAVGWGIHYYHSPCDGIIRNNTVFHNGQGGILVGSGSGDSCAAQGNNLVSNNIAINNGYDGRNYGVEEYGFPGINRFQNNVLHGNLPDDSIRLTTSPRSAVSGTRAIAPEDLFVRYTDDGEGDYHLKAKLTDSGDIVGASLDETMWPPYRPPLARAVN